MGEVLLGGCGRWPGLLFGPGVAQDLYDSFCNHYFAAGHYIEGLKVGDAMCVCV